MRYGTQLIIFIGLIPFIDLNLRAFGIYGGLGANPVETIIHTNGIWGLRILIATLMLAPLNRYSGQKIYRQLAKPLGLVALFYILCHFLSYTVIDQGGDLKIVMVDIIETPYLIVGGGGFLCILSVGVMSFKSLQPWYEKNRSTISGIVYSAAVLGVWHYYWNTKTIETEALIYCLIVCVLVLWRIKVTQGKL
jgi:sulfoxide reductase heme-binding subunit YedZ